MPSRACRTLFSLPCYSWNAAVISACRHLSLWDRLARGVVSSARLPMKPLVAIAGLPPFHPGKFSPGAVSPTSLNSPYKNDACCWSLGSILKSYSRPPLDTILWIRSIC